MARPVGFSQLSSKELERRAEVMRRALAILLDGQPRRRCDLYSSDESDWADKFMRYLDREGVLVRNGLAGRNSRRQALDLAMVESLSKNLTGEQVMRGATEMTWRKNGVRARELPAEDPIVDAELAAIAVEPEVVRLGEPEQEDVVAELAQRLGGILTVLEAQHRRLGALEDLVAKLGEQVAVGVVEGLAPQLKQICEMIGRRA